MAYQFFAAEQQRQHQLEAAIHEEKQQINAFIENVWMPYATLVAVNSDIDLHKE